MTHHYEYISEKEFLGSVKQEAWIRGWELQYHTWNSKYSDEGFPDLVLVRVSPAPPRVIYVEVKSEKGGLSAEQWEWLKSLQEAGQEAYLWRPSDEREVSRVLGGPEDG